MKALPTLNSVQGYFQLRCLAQMYGKLTNNIYILFNHLIWWIRYYGTRRQVVMQLRRLRPKTAEDSLNSCVLVGNSARLQQGKAGAFIDSCQRVFRFNRFVIQGYESAVGTHTTDWVFMLTDDFVEKLMEHHPRFTMEQIECSPTIWLRGGEQEAGKQLLNRLTRHFDWKLDSFKVFDPITLATSHSLVANIKPPDGFLKASLLQLLSLNFPLSCQDHPTTGFMMIIQLLYTWPEANIFIAGIGNEPTGAQYFDKTHTASKGHYYWREKVILDYFIRCGLLRQVPSQASSSQDTRNLLQGILCGLPLIGSFQSAFNPLF